MRTRLSYLAVIVIPLLVYGTVLLSEYGTPADLLHLGPAKERVTSDQAADGILQSTMLDLSFGVAHDVADLRIVRGLGVMLLILCGVALWQVLSRGGWTELDAAAAAVCVVLLPTAQLAAAWATAWPGTLAALLSLAGFAAVESELERGGGGRVIAVFGGLMLYVGAAMCYFPSVLMALVPLTGVALARLPRIWAETRRWFWGHAAVLAAAVGLSWVIERSLQRGAGVAAASSLSERAVDLVAFALPAAWAPFVAADSSLLRVLVPVLAVATLTGLIFGVRALSALDPMHRQLWRLVMPVAVVFFAVVMLISPGSSGSYRALWPMAGVAVIGVLALVRGLSERAGQRAAWHHAAMAGIVALGAVAALGQVRGKLVEPLAEEWRAVDLAVTRAKFTPATQVQLVVPSTEVDSRVPPAQFGARVAAYPAAAREAFEAAMRDRFPSGLPKGVKVHLDVRQQGQPTDPGALVIAFDGGRG